MPYNPTTNELIKFLETGAKDPFPTSYDVGNSSASERYTKVWAEYHNKIRNFIGIVQPFCTTKTATNLGVKALTYWTLNPAPSLSDIIVGSAAKAYNSGKAPPTTIFPFEIVITDSTDSYSSWSTLPGVSTPPMLYQKSSSIIDKITYGDFFGLKPMVTCTIKSSLESAYSTRWLVNSYCVNGTDTLLIRGSIVDITGTGISTSQLPSLASSFPESDLQKLHVTIVGVRT